jgi:CheY-like chemotaxis protein
VRLDVVAEADGGVSFRLLDDGPGLDPEVLESVFRFGSRPAGRREPGQGLGLHIVKSISERIGARIDIANRPAGGLQAVLSIPGALCSREGTVPDKAAAPRADLSGLRVLLAEDNPTNQMVATQMLRALGAEVTVCGDGLQALERFEELAVDLVVVDIEMPRLSGLDVIRAIRARADARARVPIVALTAYAMREHRDRISEAGADGLISKPITSIEALGRGLAAHVRREPASPIAAGPRPEEAGVIDLAVFEALSAAIGADTMAELLEKVIADLTRAGEELAAALPALDRPAIRSASHILVSVAGALGAVRLQDSARRLNASAHGEAADGIVDELRRCLVEIDHAVAFARERRGEV